MGVKILICAKPICEPCFCDALLRRERWPQDSAAATLYRRPATQELLGRHDQGLRPGGREVCAVIGPFAGRVDSPRRAGVSDSPTGSRPLTQLLRHPARAPSGLCMWTRSRRTDELQAVPRPQRERRLPVVLSRQEVQRLFAVVENIKHKALFMMAYDAGLRLSEILNLRIEDIDS